jgi:general stress protein YciG
MSPEQRQAIAAKGGRAVPAASRSFNNPALAAEAGRKGGRAIPATKRAFSTDRALAAEAGRKGGLAQRGRAADA